MYESIRGRVGKKQNLSTVVTWVELRRLGKGIFVTRIFVKESLYSRTCRLYNYGNHLP